MSNVQLSSSALERLVARRTFPLHARTSVCRSLFGPVDHDELNRDMKSKLREMAERDQRRWNFNFESDTPLSGAYQWEETAVNTTPSFYQDSVQVGKTRTLATTAIVRQAPDLSPQEPPSQDVSARCEGRLVGCESSSSPNTTEVNQENCAVKLNSGKTSRKQVQCPRRKRVATTDTNTTHITDFFVKRRRATVETKTNESACQLSSSSIPIEQTPRKRIR